MAEPRFAAVLFDLDGTLVDSAPDLAGSANDLRCAQGLAPLPYQSLRPFVGTGARGMVGAAFGVQPGHAGFESLRDAFLARYEQRMLDQSRRFDGVTELLAAIESAGLRWGIVTNKIERYALPIVAGLALNRPGAVLVAGDTTPHAKPHPEPLFEAARRLGLQPSQCAYVGDDRRDIEAGRAAGMATVAAAWGYLGHGERVEDWAADAIVEQPADLLRWLALA
jgi:phosphoglycolate phosphatase